MTDDPLDPVEGLLSRDLTDQLGRLQDDLADGLRLEARLDALGRLDRLVLELRAATADARCWLIAREASRSTSRATAARLGLSLAVVGRATARAKALEGWLDE